jgi:hypothetical protein
MPYSRFVTQFVMIRRRISAFADSLGTTIHEFA